MSEDRKVGFVVTAENDTKRTFDEIKRDAQGMAQAVSKAGQDAGKGLSGVGDGAAPASQKVDRATRSMIQSIQRMTARMEAGSSANAKYWETLAQQRGVDPNVLRPYLEQLDQVRLKQLQATAALGAGGIEFNKYGLSAKQTAAAMRGVPAQITDIVVALQGGQRPMTVLLQQGGQLKDMFGGIVPAAQALGSTMLKMVNPVVLAGGALAGMYAAYRMGAGEAEAFNRTLIMTGNAAGTSVEQLQNMAARIDGVIGTQRRAAAVLNEFARTGSVAAHNFEQFAAAAILWEEATGTAAAETVKQFEELGKSPVEAADKLNASMNFLTDATREQIKALQDAGRESEAAAVVQRAFADSINERAPQILQNLGLIERGWRAIKGAISEAIDEALEFGRPETLQDKLNKELEKLRSMEVLRNMGAPDPFGRYEQQRALIAHLQEQINLQQKLLGYENERRQRQRDADAQAEFRKNYLGDSDRQTREQQRVEAIQKEEKAFQRAIQGLSQDSKEYERIYAAHKTALLNIDKQFEEKHSGGISATQTELARLRAAVEAERLREEQLHASAGALSTLNEHEKAAIQYGEKLKLTTDGKVKAQLQQNKALAEEAGARKRANDSFEKEQRERQSAIDAAKKQTQSLRDQIETYGMGRSAIEAMTIARLEERLAIAESNDVSPATIEGLQRELAVRRELLSAMRTKEQLDAQLKEWQAWEKEVDRIFDQLGQSLTDQLFEGGVNARDLLKDLFKNMVFRVAVQPVMGAMQGWVTNQLGGMFGYSDPRQGGGILGMAQNASSLHSAFTGGFTDTMAGGINWLGEQFGSSALKSFAAGMTGTAAVASTSLGAATMVPGLGVGVAGGAAATGGVISGTAGLIPGLGVGAGGGAAAAGGVASGAAASGAAGAGAAFAAAAPWVLGGLAVAGLLGGMDFGGETRKGGTYVYDHRTGRAAHDGGWIKGMPSDQVSGAVNSMVDATAQQINSILQAIDPNVYLAKLHGEVEDSEKDRGGVSSGGVIVGAGGLTPEEVAAQTYRAGQPLSHQYPDEGGIQFGTFQRGQGFGPDSGSLEEMIQYLAVDLQQTTIQALQSVSHILPETLKGMVEGIDAKALGVEQSAAVVAQIQAVVQGVTAFQSAVEQLPFENLKGLAFDAAASLIQLAGGIDGLLAAEQSYIQNFYSDAERTQMTWDAIGRVLGGVNMAVPETRDQFRAVKESLDLNSESGRQAYAALMSVQDAFASVTLSAEDLAAAAERAKEAVWNAAVAAGESAYSALTRAVSAEKTRLQKESQAIADALRNSISAASTTVSELTSLTGRLTSTVQRMIGQGLDEGRNREWAQARIERALAVATLTGVMPEGADFEQALQIVAQPSQGLFDNFEDYQADFLRSAHDVSKLNELAGVQLTTEQRALESLQAQLTQSQEWYQAEMARLDAMLEYQRQQLDMALGEHEALISIPAALAGIASAIGNIQTTAAATNYGGGGGSGGGGTYYDAKLAQLKSIGSTHAGVDWTQATVGDLAAYFAQEGLTPQEHWEKWGKYEGLARPSFAVGTNYVPYDMTADIHAGERIVPAADNRALIQALQNGNRSDNEIKLLRQELREMRLMQQRLLDDIAQNTYDTSRTNKEMTERPQDVRVTNVVPTVAATPGT